jgi:Domain of unknown function (DUF4157)
MSAEFVAPEPKSRKSLDDQRAARRWRQHRAALTSLAVRPRSDDHRAPLRRRIDDSLRADPEHIPEPGAVGPAGGLLSDEQEVAIGRARGHGQRLEAETKARMEAAVGADLSRIRLHTSSTADKLTRQLSAEAFTTGADIFFRSGAYAPGTQSGARTLAHELAHTVQQGAAVTTGSRVRRSETIRRDSNQAATATGSRIARSTASLTTGQTPGEAPGSARIRRSATASPGRDVPGARARTRHGADLAPEARLREATPSSLVQGKVVVTRNDERGIRGSVAAGLVQRTFTHESKPLATARTSPGRRADLVNALKKLATDLGVEWMTIYPPFEHAENAAEARDLIPWLIDALPVALEGDNPSVEEFLKRLNNGSFYERLSAASSVAPPSLLPLPALTTPMDVVSPGDDSRTSATKRTRSNSATTDATDDSSKKQKSELQIFKQALVTALSKEGWEAWGGGQSLVLFKPVPAIAGGPELNAKTKKAEIHDRSPSVIGPQPYAGRRIRQAMRWLSTVAFRHLNNEGVDTREIQAALALGKIHIAGNTRGSLKKLDELTTEKSGVQAVQAMISAIEDVERDLVVKIEALKAADQGKEARKLEGDLLTDREKKHIRKTKARLLQTGAQSPDDWAPVRSALAAQGAFTICWMGSGNLHAERRIEQQLGSDFDPAMLGGVKRPCLACKISLHGAASSVRSGPYWPSEDANIGIENYEERAVEEMAKQVNEVANTYVTLVSKDGEKSVTADYDTDSDSDID